MPQERPLRGHWLPGSAPAPFTAMRSSRGKSFPAPIWDSSPKEGPTLFFPLSLVWESPPKLPNEFSPLYFDLITDMEFYL